MVLLRFAAVTTHKLAIRADWLKPQIWLGAANNVTKCMLLLRFASVTTIKLFIRAVICGETS